MADSRLAHDVRMLAALLAFEPGDVRAEVAEIAVEIAEAIDSGSVSRSSRGLGMESADALLEQLVTEVLTAGPPSAADGFWLRRARTAVGRLGAPAYLRR